MTSLRTDLLTADELAARLGIGRDLVYAGARKGQGIPARMIGRRFYCRVAWVERFESGEPGFWDSPADVTPEPKVNPFLRKIA